MSELSAISQEKYSKWFQVHPALKVSLMDHLYNRLDGAYPHKWRSAFPNQTAIDNWMVSWAEEFEDSGITPEHIKAGLKACRTKYDWPPSCAEFIKACLPSLDPTVAYYQAVAGCQARSRGDIGDWPHPAIYWASRPLSFDLLNQSYSQIKARWEIALAEQLEKSEWDEIPKPMIALVAPGKGDLSKEKAAQLMAEYKAADISKKLEDKTDHRLWAKRIMERHKKGDKTLSNIQINFAKEALEV